MIRASQEFVVGAFQCPGGRVDDAGERDLGPGLKSRLESDLLRELKSGPAGIKKKRQLSSRSGSLRL